MSRCTPAYGIVVKIWSCLLQSGWWSFWGEGLARAPSAANVMGNLLGGMATISSTVPQSRPPASPYGLTFHCFCNDHGKNEAISCHPNTSLIGLGKLCKGVGRGLFFFSPKLPPPHKHVPFVRSVKEGRKLKLAGSLSL